jgi:hypothetical protein
MNHGLMAAAVLSVLIALVHSVVGEYRIFRPLRHAGQLVPTEGGTLLRKFQVRILGGTWHGLSAMGLGLATVLIWLDETAARAASASRVEWCVALSMATTALIVLVSNRGRHPAWLALWGAAVLVLTSR